MDVAAEEYRQREATAAPAEPEFNLEDELNALLGNIRSNQVAAATAPAPASPIVAEAPEVEQPAAPSYEESRPSAYEPPSFRAEPPSYRPEPISFDAPEHPADIEDNLSWDLDDAFAVEPAREPVEEDQAYADEDQPEAYAEDEQYEAYAEAEQPEDVYARDPAAEDDLASLNFDDLSFEPAAEERPSTQYGDALAGAAVGAAASRFGSAFASRPFETAAPTRLSDLPRAPVGERFAEHPQAAAYEPEPFSPHRDPVVRGNPLKEDPLDIITQLAEKYSKKEPVTPYGRAMGVARGSIPFEESPADEDIDISAAFEEQPDVETVDVADQAVALADDLDIPELAEEEELPPVSAYDDLDAEFSSLLSDMNADPRPAQPASGQGGTYASFEAQPYENQMAAQMGAAAGASRQAPAARKAYDDDPEQDSFRARRRRPAGKPCPLRRPVRRRRIRLRPGHGPGDRTAASRSRRTPAAEIAGHAACSTGRRRCADWRHRRLRVLLWRRFERRCAGAGQGRRRPGQGEAGESGRRHRAQPGQQGLRDGRRRGCCRRAAAGKSSSPPPKSRST